MDNMMRVAGRTSDGKAKAIKTNAEGNIESSLTKRNELVTYSTSTIEANSTKSVVNRFSGIENYSAIVVAVSLPTEANIQVVHNWYIQTNPPSAGTQVDRHVLLDTQSIKHFATEYLEIKGTQLSIVVANSTEEAIEATVYIMGIR